MSKYKLENTYLFDGFIVDGIRKSKYKDKDAVFIKLKRNQKKLYALPAIPNIEPIMIRRSSKLEIFPAVNLLLSLRLK